MTAVVESPTDGPSAPQQGREPVACAVPGGTRVPVVVEGVGGAGTVLLSGPVEGHGPESLLAHVGWWGALPDLGATQVRGLLDASGLDGRGGGGFPLGRKVSAALARGVTPRLVVNAGESEPASRKDRTLCGLRPHLVLDGAALLARSLGVTSVVVHLHRSSPGVAVALGGAVAERASAGWDAIDWTVSLGPDRYVSSEASAVAGYLHDGDARPRFTVVPLAVEGPGGVPTVVSNAETVAHLAVIGRIGPEAWVALGLGRSPGSRLATLVGGVAQPGRVVEMVGPVSVGDLLRAGGVEAPPAAVLFGGFAGTWVDGARAWDTLYERSMLTALGASPGCGLVGVLPHGSCGLRESARLVGYLAGESAGQCGGCVAGLPRLADAMEQLAAGSLRRRALRGVGTLADEIFGSGACGHPDGVVRLVRSTLSVFEDDVIRHLAGSPCRGAGAPPVFDVPDAPRSGVPRRPVEFR